MSAADEVLVEMKRFWIALPELRERLEGRWVVFYEGRVLSDHSDEVAALRAAEQDPGKDKPFVVAAVEESKAIPLSAMSVYAVQLHA